MMWTRFIGVDYNDLVGCCECGSELLGFIKGRESFEYLTDC